MTRKSLTPVLAPPACCSSSRSRRRPSTLGRRSARSVYWALACGLLSIAWVPLASGDAREPMDHAASSAHQMGISSWYGPGFQGRPTASGEAFDMHQLTAAHRTLPLLSYARVTHVGNGRSVIVKINDRGPFRGKRILDLSYAAAQAVGIRGTATVRIEPIDPSRTQPQREAIDAGER